MHIANQQQKMQRNFSFNYFAPINTVSKASQTTAVSGCNITVKNSIHLQRPKSQQEQQQHMETSFHCLSKSGKKIIFQCQVTDQHFSVSRAEKTCQDRKT